MLAGYRRCIQRCCAVRRSIIGAILIISIQLLSLAKGGLEVPLNLRIVLAGHLDHPLQVCVDLSALVNLLDVPLALLFDLVDASLEPGDHLPHLRLIVLLFA